MNPVLIHGSTTECLAHYFGSNSSGKDMARLKSLAKFVGVRDKSVRHWVRQLHMPDGIRLLKTRYFLAAAGYGVAELEDLSSAVRDFGRLIAYDAINLHYGANCIGLKPHTVLQIILGATGTSTVSEEKMQKTYGAFEPALALRKLEIRNGLPKAAPTPAYIQCVSGTVRQTDEADAKMFADDHTLIIDALAAHLNAMVSLARRVLSADYSTEDRRHLREIADVFEISNLLNRLCSETARELKSTRWHGKK